MTSIFGMFMESWLLRVSCKVSEAARLHLLCKRSYLWFREQTQLIFTFVINLYIIYSLGKQTVLFLIWTRIISFVGMLNRKAEQPVWTRTTTGANKTFVLHIRLRDQTPVTLLVFEAYCTDKRDRQLSINYIYFLSLWTVSCKNLLIY